MVDTGHHLLKDAWTEKLTKYFPVFVLSFSELSHGTKRNMKVVMC